MKHIERQTEETLAPSGIGRKRSGVEGISQAFTNMEKNSDLMMGMTRNHRRSETVIQ